jgi:hypothetical protein
LVNSSQAGFFGSDYTAGFVSCAYGVHNVGYVAIFSGVVDAGFSVAFGFIIKIIGRVPGARFTNC